LLTPSLICGSLAQTYYVKKLEVSAVNSSFGSEAHEVFKAQIFVAYRSLEFME
jgi:hypothetical protein